jgi:hypothetical protein
MVYQAGGVHHRAGLAHGVEGGAHPGAVGEARADELAAGAVGHGGDLRLGVDPGDRATERIQGDGGAARDGIDGADDEVAGVEALGLPDKTIAAAHLELS